MKILKEGKFPVKTIRWYKVICNKCKTEFTFSAADTSVKIITEKCLNGKSEYTLNCPFCKEEIFGDLKFLAYVDLLEDQEPTVDTLFTTAIPVPNIESTNPCEGCE